MLVLRLKTFQIETKFSFTLYVVLSKSSYANIEEFDELIRSNMTVALSFCLSVYFFIGDFFTQLSHESIIREFSGLRHALSILEKYLQVF